MWSFKPAKYWQIELKTPIEQFPQCPWTGLNPCLGNQLISFLLLCPRMKVWPADRQPDKGTYTSCSQLKRPIIHQTAATKDNCTTEERLMNSLVPQLCDTPLLPTSRSAQLWLRFATWDMNAWFLCHSQDQRSSSRPLKLCKKYQTPHISLYTSYSSTFTALLPASHAY